jgi:hypothetical protein
VMRVVLVQVRAGIRATQAASYLNFVVDVASAPDEASRQIERLLPYDLVWAFNRTATLRTLCIRTKSMSMVTTILTIARQGVGEGKIS